MREHVQIAKKLFGTRPQVRAGQANAQSTAKSGPLPKLFRAMSVAGGEREAEAADLRQQLSGPDAKPGEPAADATPADLKGRAGTAESSEEPEAEEEDVSSPS